uniref:C2H2-type domain-containing protein n=1 Tax=Arcella intermedia TaxID=1963864 RepID=A0A6B2LJI3_9EUKA
MATQIDRKYKCPIPDCPRAYGTEGALKFHYKNKHKGDLEQSYSPLASDEAAAGGVGAGLGSLGVFPGPFEGLAASGIFQVPPDMFPPGTFQNPVALFPINGPVFKSIIPPLVFDPNFSQPKENAAGGSPKEENEAEGESDNLVLPPLPRLCTLLLRRWKLQKTLKRKNLSCWYLFQQFLY